MSFTFIYHKDTDTWEFIITPISFTLTREDMQKLAREIDIELLDTDPQWQKHLKDSLFKDE